jgi:hypothetical protein
MALKWVHQKVWCSQIYLVDVLTLPVEPGIQPAPLAQGNDLDASEASQSESGGLEVDAEIMSIGDSDVVVPPVVSGENSINSGTTEVQKHSSSYNRTFSLPASPIHTNEARAFNSASYKKREASNMHEDAPVPKPKKTEAVVAPEPSDSERKYGE